jgi:hypothetical protein
MSNREQFFYNNAGWSYDPATETSEQGRWKCARKLAAAEEWAARVNLEYEWGEDWDSCEHEYEPRPDSCEYCMASLGKEVLASLGCIDDATDDYRRVIEAELALEAYSLIINDLERI